MRVTTRISDLREDGTGRIGAFAGREMLDAEQIVAAAGAASAALRRPLRIRLPLYPLKGYSLTVNVKSLAAAPSISVTPGLHP